MKINCNATSPGYSIVLPPSPGSALGYTSPAGVSSSSLSPASSSMILSPLQPHKANKAGDSPYPISPSQLHKTSTLYPSNVYNSDTNDNDLHTADKHNNNNNDFNNSSYNNNKENYANFNDTHPTNHNDNNSNIKRKYESSDLSAHSKFKRTIHGETTDTSCTITTPMYTSSSFSSSVFSTDDSIACESILLDENKILDNKIKLLEYANSILDKTSIEMATTPDSESDMQEDKKRKLREEEQEEDEGNNREERDALATALEEHKKRVISRFLADGADFRSADDDDDDDNDDDDDDDDYDEDEENSDDGGMVLSKLAYSIPDGVKYSDPHLYSLSPPSSHSHPSDDTRDIIYSAIAAQWEKEAAAPKEKEEEFNPYTFIRNLPSRSLASPLPSSILLPPLLPAESKLFTLVLDLDETLVHCSTDSLAQPDLVFPVLFNSVEYTVFARKRPHIQEFLARVSELFEVVVFTASQEVYADKLLDILDPEKKYIKYRLFRDSCLCVEGNYLKDLTVLGRDLSKVIIVDNSPQAFGYHIDNGIPIESWFDDDTDTELLSVSTFLESLLTTDDVRPLIREKYKLHELISRA